MKVLFVGVFEKSRKSTNTSQILSFKKIGCEVTGYNYRSRALKIGNHERDREMVSIVKERAFDLVVFSKCNVVSAEVFSEISRYTKTCLWFMDPLMSYDEEMRSKTALVNYFCCDKSNVLDEAKKYNQMSFQVCEGYDSDVDYPWDKEVHKKYEVSFIGSVYGDRSKIIQSITAPVKLISGVYGRDHAKAVAESKINLNLSTSSGASDRVYKVLASGGFLLTNDWVGRKKHFKDGKDLVIFNTIEDLNKKIKIFLQDEELRRSIAASGRQSVRGLDRDSWAKEIIRLYEQTK